ncbi:MAG: peptidyl-tRNA hydrolase, partial [Hellea sp.]|nr:peptidyl-tRNA hydrolase [Hellea sp.]
MLLIVGLGNPGKNYQNNRHNIGFMVIDSLVGKYDLSPAKTQFNALVHTGKIKDKKVIFLKPLTFMNNSGRSVRAAMNFYK